MPLPCPNCKKPITDEKDVRWFGNEDGKSTAAVYCCPECYSDAMRFWESLLSALKPILDTGKESIRRALAEGRFHQVSQPASKKEILEAALTLKDWSDARRAPTKPTE